MTMTIERIAFDQSDTLQSLDDASRDIIKGKLMNDFTTNFDTVYELPTCLLISGRTAQSQNLLETIGIDSETRLSIYLKMISRSGLASVIDHSGIIDADTRFLYFNYKSYTELCTDKLENLHTEYLSKITTTHIITEISWDISFLIVLQLPSKQANRFESILNNIYISL